MASDPHSAPATKFPDPIVCSCGFVGPRAHRHLDQPATISEVLTSVEARAFWERVYIAALDEAHKQRTVEVPWSVRAAEIADTAVERWRERFERKGE